MSQITEQIKEKLNIVDFLKEYIQLLPAGRNFKSLCPFHKETNPSFMVSTDRQSWYCFGGCNEGGDIFKFLMKYENLEFYEALKALAEKAGIDLKPSNAQFTDYQSHNTLYEINNAAKNFFKELLWDKTSGAPLSYLLNRGLKKETIVEFELGFAPQNSDVLMRYLLKLGFSVQNIERAGIIVRTERGTYWDRFRGRIMFPIFNSFGKTVGFTGRVFEDGTAGSPSGGIQAAKYMNSPESPIFNKSRLLYGLHKTKKHIRELNFAVLVEGQMDFLMAYQDGIKNAIATSGTALTESHLNTLRRLTEKLILSFDSDEAGQLAAERSIDLSAAHDFNVRLLIIEGSKDPAEIVFNKPGAMAEMIKQAQPAMLFYFKRYLSGDSSFNQKTAVRQVLSKIKNIFSSIEQAAWIKELSNRTGIAEQALADEMEKLPTVSGKQRAGSGLLQAAAAKLEPNWTRKQLIAQRIIELANILAANGYKERVEEYAGECLSGPAPEELLLRASFENSSLAPERRKEELEELMKQLKLESLKEKRKKLKHEIISAEKNNQDGALPELLKEFDRINKEFHNMTQR